MMLITRLNLLMVKYLQTFSAERFYFIYQMSSKKNIIFIYNAKGGQWNYLIDTLHKYLSPKTYECNLCQITYDLKMRKAWKDFIEESPHNYKFLHLEELSEFSLEAYVNDLPICLEELNGKHNVLIDKNEMNTFQNEHELIESLKTKL